LEFPPIFEDFLTVPVYYLFKDVSFDMEALLMLDSEWPMDPITLPTPSAREFCDRSLELIDVFGEVNLPLLTEV